MSHSAVAESTVPERSWQASLELQFERRGDSTRLSHSCHSGPLYVQKPFYPEGPEHPHIYLLHPPGGIVSGDCLEINIDAKANTGVLVTTPGAARIYRAREQQSLQRQSIDLTVGEDAVIEWFPLETIVFNEACVELSTTIDIADGGFFIGWEICCFGLPASDQPFINGSFQQHYLVRRAGMPLFVDRLVLNENLNLMLQGKAGLRANSVAGFFLLGPVPDDVDNNLEKLRERAIEMAVQDVVTVTRVGEFYIGRYLGNSAEQAKNIFTQWWTVLRPLLINRKACAPRIWST